jgi:hypothetical protein
MVATVQFRILFPHLMSGKAKKYMDLQKCIVSRFHLCESLSLVLREKIGRGCLEGYYGDEHTEN